MQASCRIRCFFDGLQPFYLVESKEKCIFATRKIMFTAGEHKFIAYEHIFKGVEHKFTVHKHKIYRTEKKNR